MASLDHNPPQQQFRSFEPLRVEMNTLGGINNDYLPHDIKYGTRNLPDKTWSLTSANDVPSNGNAAHTST